MPRSSSLRRASIGSLSLGLLALGVWLWLGPFEGSDANVAVGACWRVGLVLAAIWLAYPQIDRVPVWFLPTSLIVLILIAWRPRLMILAVPLLVALWALRPRS